MKQSCHRNHHVPSFLFLLLTASAVHAFNPIKFEDGTTLDISLHVSYANLKRLDKPTRINDYRVQPSPSGGVVNPSFPLKGSLWSPAVDTFTQMETMINTDDGNNSVDKHGTISNRVSALLDVNLTRENYRAFLRLNSFRDEALFKPNDNTQQGTYNGIGPSNRYTEEARNLIGQRTRVLDAYIQGRWKLGQDGTLPLHVKAGRQVVNWGEGLFFLGIGSSMNPMDQVKGMTPGVPGQEALLPTEQIYATLGLNEKLTLMAYQKWRFRETEQAPRGTYFSPNDLLAPGASFQYALPWDAFGKFKGLGLPKELAGLLPSGGYGARRGDDIGRTAKGQWGIGAKYQYTDKTDLGFYHLRYTETAGQPQFGFGQTYWKLGHGPVSSVPGSANYDVNATLLDTINLLTPYSASYNVRFMNDIKLTGASFSTMIGASSVAGDMAYRSGAPLMLSNLHYNLAPARTLNANLNFLRGWSGSEFLGGFTRAERIIMGAELAIQHLIGFDVPEYAVAPWQAKAAKGPAVPVFDRNAAAYVLRLELAYTPFPEWELSIPMFYWRQIVGNGAVQGAWNSGLTGKDSARASIETKFTYKQNLELGMTLTRFLGDYDMRFHTFNPFADRSFVSFNAGYHF